MRIHLPAETWEEILNWLKRPKFAKKMEQLWDREFTQIAHNWLHKWHRNVCIGTLHLELSHYKVKRASLTKCTLDTPCVKHYKEVPIADMELPGNITSFQLISISYLDPIVMNFLHQMRSILSKVHLLIGGSPSKPSKLDFYCSIGFLLPTITGPLESLSIFDEQILRLFKDYFPAVLANAKMLSYPDEGSSVSDWTMQCLANWLFSPYAEGQPRKLLFIVSEGNLELYNSLIEEIRKRFIIPNRRSCSFFIKVSFLETHNAVEDSFNENIAMDEQLTMRYVPSAQRDEDQWQFDEPLDVRKLNGMLIRCHSNNEDKERIAKIEQELLDWNVHDKERRISVWNPKIGQGNEADEKNDEDGKPGTSQQQANGSQSDEDEEEANGEESTNIDKERKKLSDPDEED